VDETGVCTADKDAEEAESSCKKLGIPFRTVNLVQEYWNEVFTDMIEDYSRGLTPNPDILCNSRVKFTHFYDHAVNTIGCDAVATGHYARNSLGPDLEHRDSGRRAQLLKAVDRVKDQTFFLSQISQKPLARTMFPVGDITKDVVKKIAVQAGFGNVAQRKESMGICFVGKKLAPGRRGFQEFIADYVEPKEGNFVDVDTGRVVGSHQGVHQWTIGQRTRVMVDDKSYYVVSKDADSQVIRVAPGIDHTSLYTDTFFTETPHWIGPAPVLLRSSECEFRFQNVAPLTQCVIRHGMSTSPSGNYDYVDMRGGLIVSVAEPLRAVTPGQFSVFYQGDTCLGCARIARPGPSLYDLSTVPSRRIGD